jgi:protein O-mannosyl-transferase
MAKKQKSTPIQPPRPAAKPAAAQRTTARKLPERVAALAKDGPSWLVWLFAGLGVGLYLMTMGYDYTLDDFGVMKDNWVVKGQHFGKMFTTEYRYGSWASPGSLYRPLVLFMFSIEWLISGGKPWLGHLMNAIFYGATGWALWVTWRRILSDYPWTLTAVMVLLFMAHPVHVEVVANIKSRDEICSLLGATLAMYFLWSHFEDGRSKWLWLAVVSYFLGMLCKEGGFMFILIYPLTLYFFNPKVANGKSEERLLDTSKIVTLSALMAAPALIFALIRKVVLSGQKQLVTLADGSKIQKEISETYSILDNFMTDTSIVERFPSAMMMGWKYLSVMVAPQRLVSDMGYPQVSMVGFGHWEAIAGTIAFFGMGILAVVLTRRRHVLAYAIWFFLIHFGLVSNVLFLIGTSYGERLLYTPSLGFALAVSWLLHWALGYFNGKKTPNPIILWSIVGVLTLALSVRTIMRNPAWLDSNALYEADIVSSPNCAKLNYHRALEITNHGLDKETGAITDTTTYLRGLDAFTRCIELYPAYHDAYGSRALSYYRLNQTGKALADYRTALKYRPNDAKVLSNMGKIYFMRAERPGGIVMIHELDSAEYSYRQAIKYDPRFVDARRNLGAVLAMKKNFPDAIKEWKEGLKYEPNSEVLHRYIGSAYRDMNNMQEAAPWLEKAERLRTSPQKAQ